MPMARSSIRVATRLESGNRPWTPSFSPDRNDDGADAMPNRAQQIYKQEFRFGLAGVSLGNEFNKHTDKEAEGTLEATWEVGVRYFDVAPWYGFGLAERRFGHFLNNKKREHYLLSSKVGKLFKASKDNRHAEIYPRAPLDRGQPAAPRREQFGRRVRARHFPGLRLFPQRLGGAVRHRPQGRLSGAFEDARRGHHTRLGHRSEHAATHAKGHG
jgi:hypothetical protein